MEKITEATVDLAFINIKENNFQIPEEDTQAFEILADKNIISKKLADKLKDAKGMRNIIAHQYGNLDDQKVYESLVHELIDDISEFISQINRSN